MDRYKKRLIKNGIVLPAIIAVVAAVLFFAVLGMLKSAFPFTEKAVCIAEYEKADIITAEKAEPEGNGAISKNDLPALSPNTLIGSAEANGKSLELIYDANEVNALGRLNISGDSKLAGETGTVFVSCYKADADFIKSLKVGDTVELNITYGSYKYEVAAVTETDNPSLAKKQGDGIGRALVLYTDKSSGSGISDRCIAVVCEMTDGRPVTQ